MKGKPRPAWSKPRHAWLTRLAEVGTVASPETKGEAIAAFSTRALGWTRWAPWGGPGESITESGRVALARFNAGERGLLVPKDPLPDDRQARLQEFDTRMGFAMQKGDARTLALWLATNNLGDAVVEAIEAMATEAIGYHRGGYVTLPPPDLKAFPIVTGHDEAWAMFGPRGNLPERLQRALSCRCTLPDQPVRVPARDLKPLVVDVTVGSGYPAPELGAPPRAARPFLPPGRVTCPVCNGKGKARGFPCRRCNGSGSIRRGSTPL